MATPTMMVLALATFIKKYFDMILYQLYLCKNNTHKLLIEHKSTLHIRSIQDKAINETSSHNYK